MNNCNALRHVGIVVSDIDEAKNVFQDYLGMELLLTTGYQTGSYQEKLVGINNVKMKAAILRTEDDNRIELLQYFDPEGKKRDKILSNDIGVSHFAVTVSDIDYLYNKRKNYPVKFISPPTLSPDGFVKVAYAVLMEECLIEIVQVLDKRAKYTGGEVKK